MGGQVWSTVVDVSDELPHLVRTGEVSLLSIERALAGRLNPSG